MRNILRHSRMECDHWVAGPDRRHNWHEVAKRTRGLGRQGILGNPNCWSRVGMKNISLHWKGGLFMLTVFNHEPIVPKSIINHLPYPKQQFAQMILPYPEALKINNQSIIALLRWPPPSRPRLPSSPSHSNRTQMSTRSSTFSGTI